MLAWIIIADDLTGACDTGAAFAAAGWRTRVSLGGRVCFSTVQVFVLSSETRAIQEIESVRIVERLAEDLISAAQDAVAPVSVYKKIDSTLRGHPGAELEAVMRVTGIQRALVTPAFPAQGRTVVGGRVLIHGQSLEETAFAADVHESEMTRLFSNAVCVQHISLESIRCGQMAEKLAGPGVYLADAETEADLLALASAGWQAGIRLFCGSAGLAQALAALVKNPRVSEQARGGRAPESMESFIPRPEPVLVVAGSRHPAALRQVDVLRKGPVSVLDLPWNGLPAGDDWVEVPGCEAVLIAPGIPVYQPGAEMEIVAGLANTAAQWMDRAVVSGLVLTGGETAAAVCGQLSCGVIDLSGEVRPGMGWGRLAEGPYDGLPVVTKAGGFGDENALAEAVAFLRGR